MNIKNEPIMGEMILNYLPINNDRRHNFGRFFTFFHIENIKIKFCYEQLPIKIT